MVIRQCLKIKSGKALLSWLFYNVNQAFKLNWELTKKSSLNLKILNKIGKGNIIIGHILQAKY